MSLYKKNKISVMLEFFFVTAISRRLLHCMHC